MLGWKVPWVYFQKCSDRYPGDIFTHLYTITNQLTLYSESMRKYKFKHSMKSIVKLLEESNNDESMCSLKADIVGSCPLCLKNEKTPTMYA